MSIFLALDFETASTRADSACALGLVLAAGGRIVQCEHHLIRPPRPEFRFTWLHGISWADVAGAPDFAGLWPAIAGRFQGIDFIAAHNAPFDRRVMDACCERSGIKPPPAPWACTVRVARRQWNLRPAGLSDVCRFLAIPLDHHRADSDAAACARIVLAAEEEGWRFRAPGRPPPPF